ncbi:hypothetical protein HF521_009676 [Silurus meridionalis]|uniref:Thyroid hormone receptor interactor 11 n=1 Tax=Silurus meridionalis TaxID=175797 RepID=A0A8T0BUV0_SILME|nr:hypothetical protein HF521_009676 [Silurus meridionalis]
MASWLGGLGSGLGQSLGQVGGSLSSFTGQISSFTKDILLEGAEEVGDAATELHVSNSKLQELDSAFAAQKSEYERLRRINGELEEKLEAAEIQIKQQSLEYRTILQQKEVDISHLKARQNSLQEEVQKLRLSAHDVSSSTSDSAVLPVTTVATTTSSSSSFLSRPSAGHHGFHSDEVDLSDVLWSQQEINRLSHEVQRLEADVAHWRRVAQASKVSGAEKGDHGEILKLQRTIKELREEMGREVDEHQHELAALQDAHRQKMADMAKRHRDELAEYEERIEELEEQIQSGEDAEKEVSRLRSLTELNPSAEVEHADILELNTVINALRAEKEEIEKEKSAMVEKLQQAENLVTLSEAESSEDLQLEVMDLKNQLEQREEALKRAHVSMDTLTAELEELDRQNQEATQHLIAMKDLLATQNQKETLHQESEAQKEKLSQSAFTLNDLHMGKQQLEATMRELRDKLKKSQELGKEARMEASDLKKLLQERETQLDALREELSRAGERGDEVKGQMKVLVEKEKELQDVRRELAELKVLNEKVSSEDFELKIENRKLKEERIQVLEKVENLDRQIQDGQASLSRVVLEKDTRIEALKLEKNQLEDELSKAENRLLDQTKQYQQTIENLTRARSLDASALQMEHERTVKLNQEKDLTIASLKREMEQMVADHKDTSEMLDITVAGQKQLTELLQEKDAFAASLKAQTDEAMKDLEATVSQAKQESDALRKLVEEKDKQIGATKEKCSHLREEIDRLKDQQSRPQPMSEPRTLDVITELETEVSQLKLLETDLRKRQGH